MIDKIIFVKNAREAIEAKNFFIKNYHFSKVNDNFDEDVLRYGPCVKYVSMRREFDYRILFGTNSPDDSYFDVVKISSNLMLE